MQALTAKDIERIAGGSALGDGLACGGSLGLMYVTDGAALFFGGAAALGTCIDFESDMMALHPYYDNGVQCVEW